MRWAGGQVSRLRSWRLTPAARAPTMPRRMGGGAGPGSQGSFLLVEEFFAAGDPRFVEQLRQVHDPKRLAPFADRWIRDFRPWARLQIFEYLEQPLDRPGHETFVKRLFKGAEAKRDDALMGAFVVAFDRLVRRVRKKRHRYEWQTRQSWVEEVLFTPRNKLRSDGRVAQNPRTLAPIQVPPRNRPGARLFSYHTRYY